MRQAVILFLGLVSANMAACARPVTPPVGTPTTFMDRRAPEGPLVFENTIVFVSDTPGNYDVYLLSGDADSVALSDSAGDERFPVWSPDGSTIAVGRREANGTIDVWVMDADGAAQRRIYDSGSIFLDGIAWHPDGEMIYVNRGYFDGPGNMGLKVIAVFVDGPETQSGVGVERLWDTHYTYSGPTLTRDGERVAFGHYEGYAMPFRQDIYVANLSSDGTSVRRIVQLTEEEGKDLSPAWSPDGTAIAWVHETAKDSGNYDVWLMNADGSEKIQLTSETGKEVDPVWSSDGRAIIFASDQGGSFQLYMRYAWGDDEVLQLTDNGANNLSPDVKPSP